MHAASYIRTEAHVSARQHERQHDQKSETDGLSKTHTTAHRPHTRW